MMGAVFLTVVFFAYYFINKTIDHLKNEAKKNFELQINSIAAQTNEIFNGAVTSLHSAQGFFAGSSEVTRLEFYNFIQTSDFFDTYPGFSAFAYIGRISNSEKEAFINVVRNDQSFSNNAYPAFIITPEGAREEYWPIVYASPEDKLSVLLGNDQMADPIRAENIAYARDIGDIALSRTTPLKQGGLGAIIAVPLYSGGIVPDTQAARRERFEGALTISLVIDDFFKSILAQYDLENQNVNIVMSVSGNETSIFKSEIPDDILTKLYGEVEFRRTVMVDTNPIDLIFKAPTQRLLSEEEFYEPIILAVIFFVIIVFVSALFVINRKIKRLADVKQNYIFISTLSHQLRTPLTIFRWNAELLSKSSANKELKQTLIASAQILNSILDRMLLYISMDKNGSVTRKKEVKIEELYDKVVGIVSKNYNISRLRRIGDQEIDKSVLIDEEAVALAISYVIENALTYNPPKKKVQIELKSGGRTVDIVVADQGYGIPKEEQERMFTEFFRASNASLGINYGSGVSMYMAKKILKKNDGEIKFTSKENEGTIFTITLKLAK